LGLSSCWKASESEKTEEQKGGTTHNQISRFIFNHCIKKQQACKVKQTLLIRERLDCFDCFCIHSDHFVRATSAPSLRDTAAVPIFDTARLTRTRELRR